MRVAGGSKLGSFELIEKIALGGMAEIWIADRDGKRIALKVLEPEYAKDPTFRAMFQDEVDIATKLTHANIVEVYGVHHEEGLVFQSMELIEGKDLRRLLSALSRAGRWFPVRYALYVGQQVARALAYAHARRSDDGRPLEIVHRDVSPHNVMIAMDGRVKLLDFGIARAAERLARTRPGVVKGKIPYMAPEQALAVGVTPQTDIFATGVVLWEMLAMRRLFRGESDPELLEQVVRAEVPSLIEQNDKVPEDVAQLIHRMLAQRAPSRPASMQEVENELAKMIVRHFGEVTRELFAEWAHPYLDEPKRAPTEAVRADAVAGYEGDPTEPTPHLGVITEPTPIGDEPTPLEEQLSREAHGAFEEAMASWEPPSMVEGDESSGEEVDPSGETMSVAPVTASSPKRSEDTPTPAGPMTPDDSGADHLRMPTKSEIIRAVDSVATIPVQTDQAFLDRIAEQKVEVESGPVVADSDRSELEEDAVDPDAKHRAPTPARTLTMEQQGPAPPQPTTPPKTSVLPLVAVILAVVVAVMLAALMLRD